MPVIEKFTPTKIGPKSWGTELLVAHTKDYTGKVLIMKQGGTGHLQYHEQKDETFYLASGRALVEWCEEDGEIRQAEMVAGEAYHVPPGAVHRVEALTQCIFFEASTPAFDDRVVVIEHP